MQAGRDLTGDWGVDIAHGDSAATCAFTQRGQKLTGFCAPNPGTARYPASGEVNGRSVTWRVEVADDRGTHTMVFTGTIDDSVTTITGQVTGDSDLTAPFQATRLAAIA